MPFQGTPNSGGINPIALALQIREMRNREKLTQENLRLARIKAISDAQIAQAKEAREAEKAALDFRKQSLDIENSRADLAGKIPSLTTGVAEAQRSAAQEFTPSDLSVAGSPEDSADFASIVSQNDPAGIARAQEAQAALSDRVGTAARARMTVSGGSPDQAVQSVLGSARSQTREERRASEKKFREEERRMELQARIAEIADQKRFNREIGKSDLWTGSELTANKTAVLADLKPLLDADEQRRNVAKLDFSNALHILEGMTMYIKNNDDGAVVREADIAITTAMGTSTVEEALSKMSRLTKSGAALPEGLGLQIKQALNRQHEIKDELLLEKWNDKLTEADLFGWNKAQRARGLPSLSAIDRARKRIENRAQQEQVSTQANTFEIPPIDEQGLKRANSLASRVHKKPVSQVTPQEAAAAWQLLNSGGAGDGNP